MLSLCYHRCSLYDIDFAHARAVLAYISFAGYDYPELFTVSVYCTCYIMDGDPLVVEGEDGRPKLTTTFSSMNNNVQVITATFDHQRQVQNSYSYTITQRWHGSHSPITVDDGAQTPPANS